MANYLRELAKRKPLVAVQSMGHVSAAPPAGSTDQQKNDLAKAWRVIDEAMQDLGANPHTFYTADGSYAFIGGSGLTKSEMVDSSSAIQTDPTRDPPLRESGTLQGFASIRSDGLMRPAVADGSDRLEFKMYDYAFQAPTPWPHTDPGDPEADEYRRALAYTSLCLPDFNPPTPRTRAGARTCAAPTPATSV